MIYLFSSRIFIFNLFDAVKQKLIIKSIKQSFLFFFFQQKKINPNKNQQIQLHFSSTNDVFSPQYTCPLNTNSIFSFSFGLVAVLDSNIQLNIIHNHNQRFSFVCVHFEKKCNKLTSILKSVR